MWIKVVFLQQWFSISVSDKYIKHRRTSPSLNVCRDQIKDIYRNTKQEDRHLILRNNSFILIHIHMLIIHLPISFPIPLSKDYLFAYLIAYLGVSVSVSSIPALLSIHWFVSQCALVYSCVYCLHFHVFGWWKLGVLFCFFPCCFHFNSVKHEWCEKCHTNKVWLIDTLLNIFFIIKRFKWWAKTITFYEWGYF